MKKLLGILFLFLLIGGNAYPDVATNILKLKSMNDCMKCNLAGADLSGANLAKANLDEADLSGANLKGANLYRADLFRVNFSGADLRGAALSGAELYRANFTDADLSGANLKGVLHLPEATLCNTIMPWGAIENRGSLFNPGC